MPVDLTPADDRPEDTLPVGPDGARYEQVSAGHDPVLADPPAPLLTDQDVANAVESVSEILALFLPRADAPSLWILDDQEISDIAAPLTRVTARRPWLASLITSADLVVVCLVVGKAVARRAKYLRRWRTENTDPVVDVAVTDQDEEAGFRP